jgi:hypothetical protein|tara:strand:+ start:155 stop:310 length:156 start_codon:yes stop_codon:yes gene_type:complete
MGNTMSKICWIISYPIKLREERKIKKIYDEITQNDIWSSEINETDETNILI